MMHHAGSCSGALGYNAMATQCLPMPSLAAAAGSRLPLLNFTAHHQGSRFRLFIQMSYANSSWWQVRCTCVAWCTRRCQMCVGVASPYPRPPHPSSPAVQLGAALICRVVFRRLVPMQLTLVLLVVSACLRLSKRHAGLDIRAWFGRQPSCRELAVTRWPPPCTSCPCLQLPFTGKLCSTTLRNPGAADVVARLHHWATRLVALVNPLSPAAGGFGGQSSAQVSGVPA